mgnify:CR=1 FL=1
MLQKAIRVGTFLANDPRTTVKIGQTPHTVIHRENKSSVRYFAPAADAEPRTPIFISMPLINSWAIFDLLPGRSVVEALTRAGAPVYLLDWGRPTAEDQPVRAVEFIDRILHRAIDRSHRHARRTHDAEMLDMVGYFSAGTSLATRKGNVTDMAPAGDRMTLEALVPTRGLIGFEVELLNFTRGEGIMSHLFHEYAPDTGEIPARRTGALVSMEDGTVTAYALDTLQGRGRMARQHDDRSARYAGDEQRLSLSQAARAACRDRRQQRGRNGTLLRLRHLFAPPGQRSGRPPAQGR